jgi:hypothetical protein
MKSRKCHWSVHSTSSNRASPSVESGFYRCRLPTQRGMQRPVNSINLVSAGFVHRVHSPPAHIYRSPASSLLPPSLSPLLSSTSLVNESTAPTSLVHQPAIGNHSTLAVTSTGFSKIHRRNIAIPKTAPNSHQQQTVSCSVCTGGAS